MKTNIKMINTLLIFLTVFLHQGCFTNGDPGTINICEVQIGEANNLLLPMNRAQTTTSPYVSHYYTTDLTGSSNYEDGTHVIQSSHHHVIPLSTTQVFYNNIITNEHGSRFPNFLGGIAEHYPDYQDAITRANCRANPSQTFSIACTVLSLVRGYVRHDAGNQRTPRFYENYVSSILWLPGNLFEGPAPQYRTDDPGNHLEFPNVATIIGSEHYARLRRINELMDLYNTAPNRFGELQFTELDNLLGQVTAILSPFPFNPQQWLKVADRKYRVKSMSHDELKRKKRSTSNKTPKELIEELKKQNNDEVCKIKSQFYKSLTEAESNKNSKTSSDGTVSFYRDVFIALVKINVEKVKSDLVPFYT